jgi:hypothetical protein
MSLFPTGIGWKVWSPRRNVLADAVPVPSRAVGTVPAERSDAEPLVATVARPVIVPAACVPVWLARARSVASEEFAVAPDATPSTFALSLEDMEPAAEVVAAAMLTTGVVVPVATEMGAVPETFVTVPEPLLASTQAVA